MGQQVQKTVHAQAHREAALICYSAKSPAQTVRDGSTKLLGSPTIVLVIQINVNENAEQRTFSAVGQPRLSIPSASACCPATAARANLAVWQADGR